jgi:hypothetical protein
MNLRFKSETGENRFPHILNGSGTALALITIVGLAFILWAATLRSLQKITVVAILLFLPLAPTLTLFSRVLWIYLDWAIDPEFPSADR